jgi:hypothetical protein
VHDHPHPHDPGAKSQMRLWADRVGVFLSAACAIHCLLTPFMILALPSLGLFELHHQFHETLLVILPLVALLAFIPGYLNHRDRRIFFWAAPGFALIASVAFLFEHTHDILPTIVSIAGSLCLIQAHLLNRRLCACCGSDVD